MIGLLWACAPVDPLAGLQTALDELPALAEGWAPHATVAVGQASLDALATAAVQATELEARTVELDVAFLGLEVELDIAPMLEGVRVTASEACASCLELSARFAVATSAHMHNETGAMAREARWSAEALGIVELGVEEESSGDGLVVARPRELGDWSVAVEREGSAESFELPVDGMIEAALGDRELPAFPVVRLQRDAAVRVRGVRVRGIDGGVAVDQAFAVPRAGAASVVPTAGWSAVVPADTLLGLAEAAVVARGYAPEGVAVPTALVLDDGGFVLDLELWRAGGRRPVSVQLSGTVGIEADELVVRTDAELTDPLLALVGGRLVEELERAAQLAVPARHSGDVGGLEAEARLTGVLVAEGVLTVTGELAAP